jgi:hypothetical protein
MEPSYFLLFILSKFVLEGFIFPYFIPERNRVLQQIWLL